MFLWLVAHQCILTNVERFRQHIATSELCTICNTEAETVDHVLRNCSIAKRQLSANYVAAFSSSRSGVDVRRTSDFMWQRPPERCIKANSDGAMHPSSGKTTTGGVLRDDRGGNALVDALHELLDHQWKTRIRHIFREITGVADGPAAMSHGAPVAGLKFPCVPSELADLVE
ncbi:hypothetical protein V6N12_002175 [Hibiscus sabdariffa]|uniref:Reverse transcriptase zinc-binding domain-containing protein n=1 Tax=Hibiscus sabdariffa TaxID=183260 RepID=A0ABR2BHU1_9ROSI